MFGVFRVLFKGAKTTKKAKTKAKLRKAVDLLELEFSFIFWAMVLVLLKGKDWDCTLWNS